MKTLFLTITLLIASNFLIAQTTGGPIEIQGPTGEQSQGQVHIIGNGQGGPGDAYISFDEGGEANSRWSLGARDNGNQFTISHGLTMDAKPMFTITDVAGSSGGYFGIGTANPQSKFHIKAATGEPLRGQMLITGNGGNKTGDAFITFQEGAEPNSEWSIGARDEFNSFTISNGRSVDTAPKFVITDVAGRVGIGTVNPQGKVHVQGDSGEQSYGQIHVQGNGEGGPGDAYISFSEGVEPDSKWSLGVKDNQNVFSISKGLTMDADPKFMIFEDTGNVAIGTSYTGSHKLAVGGTIGAREIKVQSGTWSDFVFFKGYKLPSLQEVEKHISEKGHLQDIPSEKEVTEKGINLGEMDAKLLQKIEELMLYTIQQQKEIEILKKELQKLKQ